LIGSTINVKFRRENNTSEAGFSCFVVKESSKDHNRATRSARRQIGRENVVKMASSMDVSTPFLPPL
jgi:hypothetical protein